MEIFDLFTRRLQQRRLRPLLANLSGGARTDVALEMLLQYNVDGVIVASSTLLPEFGEACAEARLPVVQAFGRPGGKVPVNIVGADNPQGGRLAAEVLIARGYRDIAFLGGPQTATSTQDRLSGLNAGLAIAGLKPAAVVYGHSYSHEAGFTMMRELLRDGNIDAVFCGDDILSIGAIDACRDAGVAVPGDIGIMGFNDMAMAAWPSYNLTTIRQPIAEIIGKAVETVLSVIDQPLNEPEIHLFPCEAKIRGTLRPPVQSPR